MRAVVETMEGRLFLSAAVMVKDINPADLGSSPSGLTDVNGTLYFAADDGVHGRELWAIRGGGKPRLVDDINSGPASSNPSSLVGLGNLLYFAADDPTNGPALWASDGASTHPVATFPSLPTDLTVAGSTLFFVISGTGGDQLWGSDGTNVGTMKLGDFPAGMFESSRQPLVALGNKVYFTNQYGTQLWSSDGSVTGTSLAVGDLAGSSRAQDTHLTAIGSDLYFVNGWVWNSDGTPSGTNKLAFEGRIIPDSPRFFVSAANQVFFPVTIYSSTTQLDVTDGTAVGTHAVTQFGPIYEWADVLMLGSVNGRAVFGLSLDYQPYTLWSTDGTAAGTMQIGTVQPARSISDLVTMSPLSTGNELYFSGFDSHGYEPWKTDGTAAGTLLVKDIQPFESSYPTGFTASGGKVYFAADDGRHGSELWDTDGTQQGTRIVADINRQPASASPASLSAAPNGRVFFAAQDAHGVQPWVSDGTAAGTYRIKDVNPLFPSSPSSFVTVDGTTYFVVGDDGGLFAGTLWKTDGTDAGTVPVLATPPNYGPYNARDLTAVGDGLSFTAADPINSPGHRGLWKVVGNGAVMTDNLLDFNLVPMNLFNVSGTLVFEIGGRLWSSDRTASVDGTMPISPPGVFFQQGFLKRAVVLGGVLYFAVQQGGAVQLWRSDATAAGTTMLCQIPTDTTLTSCNLTAVGGKLNFVAGDGPGVLALWSSDGTGGGTQKVCDLGDATANPQQFTGAGDKLFFTLNTAAFGAELWVSDGTAAGTKMVSDIQAGAGSSDPQDLTAVRDRIYFSADDGIHGRELWCSDGTAPGTFLVQDINPGGAGSNPTDLTLSGGKLFFAADDGIHGTQLWATSVTGSISGSVSVLLQHGHSGKGFSQPLAGVTVFADTNGNGAIDPGEATAITDAAGQYTLAGLLPGSYEIRQVVPPDYTQAAPTNPVLSEVTPSQDATGPDFSDVPISRRSKARHA